MMDENVNAGMTIKSETPETVEVLDNGNTVTYRELEGGGYEADVDCSSEPIEVDPATVMASVCIARTPEGLKPDKENGKEISTIFEILEEGDQINHQTVTKVDRGGITLDYFGHISELHDEHEIFSVLIKEEIVEWKRLLKEKDLTKMFEAVEQDMVHTFRVLELICMNVNMEDVDMLYCNDRSPLAQKILAMVYGTLRKPLVESQEDLEGKKVIAINFDYKDTADNKKNIEDKNGVFLYNIAITNKENLDVNNGDTVILC